MRAEHQHVLSAAAAVLLAGAAQFQQRADQAVPHPPAQLLELRQVDVLVGDRDLHALGVGRGDHAVGGRQVRGHRLLAVDVAPGVDRGHEQFLVAVDVAGADGDDVQGLGRQHLAVIGVGVRGADLLLCGGPSGGIGVGHRHRQHAVYPHEAQVQAVTEVAAPRMSDRADAEAHLGTHGGEYTLAQRTMNRIKDDFLCEYVSGEVSLSDEHERFAWLTEEEMAERHPERKTEFAAVYACARSPAHGRGRPAADEAAR